MHILKYSYDAENSLWSEAVLQVITQAHAFSAHTHTHTHARTHARTHAHTHTMFCPIASHEMYKILKLKGPAFKWTMH